MGAATVQDLVFELVYAVVHQRVEQRDRALCLQVLVDSAPDVACAPHVALARLCVCYPVDEGRGCGYLYLYILL